ncbi:elongation factor P hydroxylase [Marinomonas primoryensis]|uniref:elongation factor P hydroxylase n=1 Tax=Marinomonas primoryensis TaxID=178399 RepID=UPI003704C048
MTDVKQLMEAFSACFLSSFNTCLVGGAAEPLYLPAQTDVPATVYFRFDYLSSALHEVSHWCIAGHERRCLEDYGYWYESDSRDLSTQLEFERVEVRPQAVECVLHWVAGLPFRVSVDNLSLPDYDARHFEQAVMDQVGEYIVSGFPARVELFSECLLKQHCSDLVLDEFLKRQYEDYCR